MALSAYTSTVVKSAGGFSGRLILILRFQRYTDFGFDFHESGLGVAWTGPDEVDGDHQIVNALRCIMARVLVYIGRDCS